MASLDPNQRKHEEARTILIRILDAGHQAMFAGGCVRDRILNLIPSDFDIASSAKPEEIIQIFRKSSFSVIPTGVDHGTVTVVGKYSSTEITSLRRDVDTDGRKAVVEFGASFEDDSKRRDFTINAMYEDIHGQIFDFHGGREDLAKNHLRFVGDPHQRIKEDYLRQLRMVRFISKFGIDVDEETTAAVSAHVSGLKQISQERITSELWKILEGRHLKNALSCLVNTGIFGEIFKGFSNPTSPLISTLHLLQHPHFDSKYTAQLRLAFLLTELSEDSTDRTQILTFLKSLRISGEELKRVLGFRNLLRAPPLQSRDEIMVFLDSIEDSKIPLSSLGDLKESLERLSYKNHLSALTTCEETYGYLRKKRPPLTGDDLMKEFQLRPGRDLGLILDKLKSAFRRGEWAEAKEGLSLAKSILDDSTKPK